MDRFIIGDSFYIIKDVETDKNYILSYSGDIKKLCNLLNELNNGNEHHEK